jgi:hypothetical protein
MHYRRWQRYGDCNIVHKPANGTLVKWLEENVSYHGDGCLQWPFGRTVSGYGALKKPNGQSTTAARMMCEMAHGPAPSPKHEAAHSCGKGDEGCVNPKHLRWATTIENHADKVEHGTLLRGTALKHSKLTEDDVREIRRSSQSLSTRQMAERFGVSHSTITRTQRRECWAWLD